MIISVRLVDIQDTPFDITVYGYTKTGILKCIKSHRTKRLSWINNIDQQCF